MPVDTKHPDYITFADKWLRAREVAAGADAVKAAGERYLPKLSGDNTEEYDRYKNRADFYNGTARTVTGFKGMVFRKPVELKEAEGLEALVKDATMSGSSLQDYAKQLFQEVVIVARAGTLVEFTDEEKGRPYFTLYKAEQIINWHMGRVNGRNVLKLVVLDEMAEESDLPEIAGDAAAQATVAAAQEQAGEESDEFEPKMVRQLRVLRFDATAATPEYIVEIWRERGNEGKKEWEKLATVRPVRRGKPLDFIPFVFHTASNCGCAVERPPLEDIILENIGHYRNSADYEHALHFVATPTPWVTGVARSGELHIGSGTAWEIENENSKVGMLEIQGHGIPAILEAMKEKKANMAMLGAMMLDSQKKQAETAEAWRIKAAGEATTLIDWCSSTSESLTMAARIAAWWQAPADKPIEDFDKVRAQLNTELVEQQLLPDQIRALVVAFQTGTMSRTTVIENFAKGGLLPAGRTPDDETALIDAQAATGMQEQKQPGEKPQ